MPYVLLVIGVLIGLFALYRFFVNADVAQIKAMFLTVILVVVVVALLLLALTGRLPAAIALVVAMVPLGIGYLRDKYKLKNKDDNGIIDVTPIEEEDDENE